MIRSVLEIIYLSSIIYLIFLYLNLFRKVVNLRRKTKTSIGFKNKELERAIRAHGNFCETVPFGILLTFILYFNNLLYFAVPSILMLCIGRKIHSNAILDLNEDTSLRVKGMRMTVKSIQLAILGVVFYILQLIYFLVVVNTTFLPQ